MGGSSLAIVEKRPSPFPGGGGCAGGVLFHLLDWHRRLARKRRLFSPRRLLPSSLRSSPRRLPRPPPAPTLTPPPPAPHPADGAADGAAPGVVARLMGLESWPAAAAAPPRPQKQRKVEAASRQGDGDGDDSAVVLVLPTSRSRRAPAPAPAPSPATRTVRSHHGADLPARSPRRTRLVHAAAAKLLDPGARASSRASAKLALAYACSSPQHRRDGHSSALPQGSGMADDFLSRSESMLAPSARVQVQPPVLLAETGRDSAAGSRRHEQRSIDNANAEIGTSTVVLPTMDFADGNISKRSFDLDTKQKESRVRDEVIRTCARVRSSAAAVQSGAERLRKRATPTRPEFSGSVNSGRIADSTRPAGHARELVSAGRRVTQKQNGSGPRREFMGSIVGQGQGSTTRRDVINRSGSASTTRVSSNGSGPKRGPRKVGRDAEASNREARNASRSSSKPVARASSCSNALKSGCQSRVSHDTNRAQMPVPDTKCMEASPSDTAASEKDEFSRLLKAKIIELGLSDRIEFTSSEMPSRKLTAPVLQELISALTNDMNPSISQSSNYDASAPVSCNGNIDCIDRSCYTFSNDQSPDFQKCYQSRSEQDIDSATSLNNEPNQPSPTSVLEASFSNDASSLGSPVEKNEGKDLFVSTENKMEDLFNLESDIVSLAMSIDTRKTDVEETLHDNEKLLCSHNFLSHDSKFLESRLHITEAAISNAELLLGSKLHPLVIEMLENTIDMFGEGEFSDISEDKYQHTNFLFDCIAESLDSKFCNFGKCGYKAWLKLPLSLGTDLLKSQVLEDISNWRDSRGTALRQVSDKEVDQVTARWDADKVEAFDISIAIGNDILEALVGEFALDLW